MRCLILRGEMPKTIIMTNSRVESCGPKLAPGGPRNGPNLDQIWTTS